MKETKGGNEARRKKGRKIDRKKERVSTRQDEEAREGVNPPKRRSKTKK